MRQAPSGSTRIDCEGVAVDEVCVEVLETTTA